METPPNYTYALTTDELALYWPNLEEGKNFHFTSLKRKGYKCIWYALMADVGGIEMLWFKEVYDLEPNSLDHSAAGYAKCFEKYYGFELCDTFDFEEGFIKVVLYEDQNGDFKHVARFLPNGNLTSKMGNYEDIEHTIDAVCGNEYGYPKLVMKKTLNEDTYQDFISKYPIL